MGRDVVVAARVTSREKLRRDFIFFLDERLDCPKGEDGGGGEGWRKTRKGIMPSTQPAPNIYSQSTPLRAQSAVLLLYKEATIVNLHNPPWLTHVPLRDSVSDIVCIMWDYINLLLLRLANMKQNTSDQLRIRKKH